MNMILATVTEVRQTRTSDDHKLATTMLRYKPLKSSAAHRVATAMMACHAAHVAYSPIDHGHQDVGDGAGTVTLAIAEFRAVRDLAKKLRTADPALLRELSLITAKLANLPR